MVRGDRSVDVFVRKLRHKLERVSREWRYVHTHFGVGYRFAAELVADTAAERVADAPETADAGMSELAAARGSGSSAPQQHRAPAAV
jgi:DNA-binding winged helix-turn-helix (wHTH) protein